MGRLRPSRGLGRIGRRRAALLALVIGLVLAALPAVASASSALWVTQRTTTTPSSNVLAFTVGPLDDILSAPVGAGTGGSDSYGIAVTPNDQYVYVTNDSAESSISEYSVDPATGDLTLLNPATVLVDPSAAGADPETVAVDPSGSWAFSANEGIGSVSSFRINPTTGVLTLENEFSTSSSPSLTLDRPTGLAVDPSGNYLYVTDYTAGVIAEFDIDTTTGALTPMSTPSIEMPEASGEDAPAPIRITTATIGSSNYAFATDAANNQVVEFTIDPSTGELSQATWPSPNNPGTYPTGSVSTDSGPVGVTVNTNTSGDPYLYVGADSVDEFDIDPSSGAISPGNFVADSGGTASGVSIAPDNDELYAGTNSQLSLYSIAADGTITADGTPTYAAGDGPSTPLAANLPSAPSAPATPVGGAISQLPYPNDCVTTDAYGCNTVLSSVTPTVSLYDSYQPVLSPDGRFVYDVAPGGDLAIFSRNASTGALTYVSCISGGGDCGAGDDDIHGMSGPQEMTISPSGTSAYVVTSDGGDGALVEFSRITSTGQLSWQGCFSRTDSHCTASVGLSNPYGVTVSPDGKNVYATSNDPSSPTVADDDSSVVEFSRNTSTGALTALAAPNNCITTNSTNPGGCATVAPAGDSGDLLYPLTVAVSPDGDDVYVAAGGTGYGGDVSELSRNPTTGALSFIPGSTCITTGATDYPNCTTTNAIGFDGGTEDLAITPDGKSVYLTAFGDNGVIELRRDPTTGVLTQLAPPNACLAEETSPSPSPPGVSCTQPPYPQQHGTAGALGVAVSPDGLDVYVSGAEDNAVTGYSRDPSTGVLTPLPLALSCITGGAEYTAGTCPQYNANGLYGPRRLAVSPDGNSIYVANQAGDNGIGGDGVVELARQLPADLALSESGAPSSATVGGQITYSYTVTNNGPAAASGPTLTVPLASQLTYVSAASSRGSCSGTTTITCNLGAMADAATATVTVTANLASTGTAAVTANVADVLDTNSYNNSVTTTTTINAQPAKTPQQPAQPQLAAPVLDQSTDVAPVTGQVLIELPNSTTFIPLSQAENIPMGSLINATNGAVQITVALPNGTTETAEFYDGEFVVTQNAGGRVFETLAGGSFAGCPAPGRKSSAGAKKKGAFELAAELLAFAKKSKTTVVRELWGNGHGDFTTKGRYGSAAVSGTIWLSEDRCDGTYFKVTKDTIVVTANARPNKHHNLKQGQSYLILAPGF